MELEIVALMDLHAVHPLHCTSVVLLIACVWRDGGLPVAGVTVLISIFIITMGLVSSLALSLIAAFLRGRVLLMMESMMVMG